MGPPVGSVYVEYRSTIQSESNSLSTVKGVGNGL